MKALRWEEQHVLSRNCEISEVRAKGSWKVEQEGVWDRVRVIGQGQDHVGSLSHHLV